MTQTEIILKHLKDYGSITPVEAYSHYAILRLGARIFDLRKAGYPITGEMVTGCNRYGKKMRYAKYRLENLDQARRLDKMIKNPEMIQESEKKIRMLIAGYPGIGKSSLALSAPKPLHIDVDFGIDRVEPRYRVPYIQPADYDEILSDLKPENLDEFETLVFDTGGKLISLMSLWAIRQNPKYGQRDGSLSLKGYGFVGKEFVRLMDYCFYELRKNIVIVFHATEEKDGDNTRLRIKVEGQTKNNVWEPMDLGGFMEMYGNDRTIGFSNCERYFAKGTRGISGVMKIPTLSENTPNDFLTKLFEKYNERARAEVEANATKKAAYDSAMKRGRAIIESIEDAKTANAVMANFKMIDHSLTSQRELNQAWNEKMKSLELTFDKAQGMYTGGRACI